MLDKTLPDVTLSEFDGIRCMHLDSPWIQGTMTIKSPYAIELEYVQRMMAWLLFVPGTSVKERHALQLGLGTAAITKCCYKILGMKTTAVEINSKVITICRQWFKLPPSNNRLEVILADASQEVKSDRWLGKVDALAVDLYDHEAAAPVMDSLEFYADCRGVLTDDGVMTVNLFGRDNSYKISVAKMQQTFGVDCVWAFKPTREGNTVVMAFRTKPDVSREVLVQRADAIESRWAGGNLPAKKWLKLLSPIAA
jgi:spermidine synthase